MFTLLTVNRRTHRYIMKAVCFADKVIPHVGHLGVSEEILKGTFSENGQKAGAMWKTGGPGSLTTSTSDAALP